MSGVRQGNVRGQKGQCHESGREMSEVRKGSVRSQVGKCQSSEGEMSLSNYATARQDSQHNYLFTKSNKRVTDKGPTPNFYDYLKFFNFC